MLLFHHTRKLEHVDHGIVPAVRLSQILPEPDCKSKGGCGARWVDEWHDAALFYEPAYEWLSLQTGFWPLFMAVGESDDDVMMTGYPNQFKRRAPGAELANDVLFSFDEVPGSVVFSDYDWWHLALMNGAWILDGSHPRAEVRLTDRERRLILKPSWKRSDWLRKARRDPHTVQAVVPQLDLRRASKVRCRNRSARKRLLEQGFTAAQVEVHRMKAPCW